MRYFKTFLLLISMCLLPNPIKAIVNDTEQPTVNVPLNVVGIDDTESGDGDRAKPIKRSKRLFTETPQLEYGNHILYYNSECDYARFALSKNGVIIYDDVFTSAGTYELQINLSGTYDIHLYIGDKVYIGTLYL